MVDTLDLQIDQMEHSQTLLVNFMHTRLDQQVDQIPLLVLVLTIMGLIVIIIAFLGMLIAIQYQHL
jgi:heme/copper-type cytochrome/quinol oxidase subunit 2